MGEDRPQDTPGAQPAAESHGHGHGHPALPKLRFIEELKRRNVGRVAILYIAVGYVTLEVFELFFHLLEMPPWTGRAAVLLAVLGFPVALTIAWAYEVTPEGLKPTDDVPAQQSIRLQTGRRLDRAIIVMLTVALCYFVADKFWLSGHGAVAATEGHATNGEASGEVAPSAPAATAPARAAVPDNSVAVLPFLDFSEKKDQEYFTDGLSEELIDLLVKIPGLRVPARTSSFYFKGKSADIPTIARQLMVAHVLEGSVRRSGKHVRVTAQLIRADNGYHLWSETFDRDREDIFKLQDEIAAAVVRALKVTLVDSVMPRASSTTNADAYELLLQARAAFHRGEQGDHEKAVGLLQQALKLDPAFASAWAELATVRVREAWWGTGPSGRTAIIDARQAAQHALDLDPKLAEAHLSMGRALYTDWEWAAADAQIAQAISLDPGNGEAYRWAGMNAETQANFGQAIEYYRQAVSRDPLEPITYIRIGDVQTHEGRFAEAEAAYRRARELDPDLTSEYYMFGLELARGQPAAALARVAQLPGNKSFAQALAYFDLGRRSEADAALAELQKQSSHYPVSMAMVYAHRGDTDLAFRWLERGFSPQDPGLNFIRTEPLLRSLERDPRYRAFLRRMKLAD